MCRCTVGLCIGFAFSVVHSWLFLPRDSLSWVSFIVFSWLNPTNSTQCQCLEWLISEMLSWTWNSASVSHLTFQCHFTVHVYWIYSQFFSALSIWPMCVYSSSLHGVSLCTLDGRLHQCPWNDSNTQLHIVQLYSAKQFQSFDDTDQNEHLAIEIRKHTSHFVLNWYVCILRCSFYVLSRLQRTNLNGVIRATS